MTSHQSTTCSRSGLARRKSTAGRIFIAPSLLSVTVFMLGPLAFSLYLSVHQWDMFSPPKYVGTANYRRLFTGDPLFLTAAKNTAVFTAVTVAATMAAAVLAAAALSATLRGIGIFRSIMFLPLVASTAAMTVVWQFMFTTEGGLVNTMLGWARIGPVPWLASPGWAMAALCIVSVWKSVPFATVVLLAAIMGVPAQLYEAARIDGAGAVRRFWSVTLPLIRPALGFVFVISIINSFQVFDQAYVLTSGNGGPETGTYVFGIMLFQNAFVFNDLGYACALAWVLFAVLFALTCLQLRLGHNENGPA